MPLTTIYSYLPTIDAFLELWAEINTALGGAPATDLKLPGGYTRANMVSDRAAIATAFEGVQSADNQVQTTGGQLDVAKAAIRLRLAQYRASVLTQLSGSGLDKGVPKMPLFKLDEKKYLQPLLEMKLDWQDINAATVAGFTPPLLLGTYTLANFTTELTALQDKYAAYTTARIRAKTKRETRDTLLATMKARLKAFRNAAIARLGPTHPLVNSIPSLAPPPGSTPEPVSVSAHWDEATGKAVIVIQASDNPNVDYYSVRNAPGPTYKTAEETVIGSVPAGGPFTFSTSVGLAAEGSEALFRVYVVLKTGNEKGSSTVKVVRPAAA